VETPLSVAAIPAEAPRWGEILVGRWTNVTDPSFVLPVLWDNSETSYHCPIEVGYRQRLSIT